MILYCLRHAESTFNAQGRIQGHLDPPLSELGRRQADAVARALGELPIEAIYASPLERAQRTVMPLAARRNLSIEIDPRLIEINAGIFQGRRIDELEREHPTEWARWRSGDPDFVIPGGQCRRELMEIGQAVMRALMSQPHGQVVVSTHGGLLAAAFKALLEIPAGRHPFRFENAAINRLDTNGPQLRVLSLNQVDHLRGIGLAGDGDL
jgi:2,3-bisphosphoglycerate-dependent phosphoglycerate mutase